MSNHLYYPVIASLFLVGACGHDGKSIAEDEGTEARHLMAEALTSESLPNNGRNIMRVADGSLVSIFKGTQRHPGSLLFASSRDDGETWTHTNILVNLDTATDGAKGRSTPSAAGSDVTSPALDANFSGVYVGYIKDGAGHLAFSTQPSAPSPRFVGSGPLTPSGISVGDTFVSASREGWGNPAIKNSVVYGWTDRSTGDIYVGFSSDGQHFPSARPIHRDPLATSGPGVAVKADRLLVIYETSDRAMAPVGLSRSSNSGGRYSVRMESLDGGETWTKPTPLFAGVDELPRIAATRIDESGKKYSGVALASGGSNGTFSQPLLWGAPKETTMLFVLSTATPVTVPNASIPAGYFDDAQNSIGVVSFRPIDGKEWTHVIANRPLERSDAVGGAIVGVTGAQHQYSALVATPVRAVTYLETTTLQDSPEQHKIVVAASLNGGKQFDHFVDFDPRASREGDLKKTSVIEVSQCLYEDRQGMVFVDVAILDGAQNSTARHVKVPLHVNANTLRDKK